MDPIDAPSNGVDAASTSADAPAQEEAAAAEPALQPKAEPVHNEPVVEMASEAATASSEAKPVGVALSAKSEAAPAPGGFTGTPAPEPADHSKLRITLDEMCLKLSAERQSPEILGAFHHTERTAKEPKMLDLESSYRERFKTFADRPVS